MIEESLPGSRHHFNHPAGVRETQMTDIINIYKEPCASIFSGKPLPPPEPAWKGVLTEIICGAFCIALCAMFACGIIFVVQKAASWMLG